MIDKIIEEYMKKAGFNKIKVPSGNPPNTMNRWVCNRVPYSSAISEFRLKDIITQTSKEYKSKIKDLEKKNLYLLTLNKSLKGQIERLKYSKSSKGGLR